MIKVFNSIKKKFLQEYLQLQFNICTKPSTSWKCLIFLGLATIISASFWYILIFIIIVSFVVACVVLVEFFPNSFGKWYIAFLKKHCGMENFSKYCGNFFITIKISLKPNQNFIITVLGNGVYKIYVGAGVALASQHTIHTLGLIEVFSYIIDRYLNNDPSTLPFLFDKNPGLSLLASLVDYLVIIIN